MGKKVEKVKAAYNKQNTPPIWTGKKFGSNAKPNKVVKKVK